MSTNDVIVLNSILEQKKAQTSGTFLDSELFELFTFEQLLKNYDLSYDELLSGNVGGRDDGGIDGFFSLIDGELLDEDSGLQTAKKNPSMELFLIQAKNSASFTESAIEHVIATISNIFDLTKDMNALKKFYNQDLISKADMFRKAYIDLAGRHPGLRVRYIYASTGDVAEVHPKVQNKAETLTTKMGECFTGAKISVEFIGARELLEFARLEKSYTLQLRFIENYISRGEDNYVVLSGIEDYFKFVTDEAGNLRRYIFESNVRDYQGDVEVNNEIKQTLQLNDDLDFWWLNNGITILASKASIVGKSITLDDVQVVNGLQTTATIYNYLKQGAKNSDKRAILIKIIVTGDAEARDRIIKATNYQTKIPDASLRATDKIHRDLEDFFKHNGWFYDRRKNFYKNMGKPANRIISIPYLAQSVMAIVLREPNNSRARPSSLIKRDTDYRRVFDESLNLGIYLFCAKSMKSVDSFIRSDLSQFTLYEKSNLKFHLATLITMRMLGKIQYNPQEIERIMKLELEQALLTQCLGDLMQMEHDYSVRVGLQFQIDRISKSSDFVEEIFRNIS